MNNKEFYKNSKIYKVIDNINPNNIYIGSTCKTLSQRISQHRTNYKEYLKFNKTKCFVSVYDIIANGNFNICLIENYPCNSKDEMNQRERYFIDSMECMNKNTTIKNDIIVPTIVLNAEEIKDDNNKMKEYRKQYYKKRVLNNKIDKEKQKVYSKKYYNKKKETQEDIIFNVIMDDLEIILNK